jgi:hypothetical protein
LIRLYMEGIQPKKDMFFAKIVEVYERLAVLRSKKGKETELAKFFQNPILPLEVKARFALGTITEESLKIGTGTRREKHKPSHRYTFQKVKLEKLMIDYGEHGEVAYLLKKPSEPVLSVERGL